MRHHAVDPRVRVLHAAPDLRRLAVTIHNGPWLSTSTRFGEATPLTGLPAGTADLEMRPDGSPVPRLVFPAYQVRAGHTYTFVLMGRFRAAPSLTVMPLAEKARAGVPA